MQKVTKEDTGGVGQQGPIGAKQGLRGVAGIQVPLGVQGHVATTGVRGERGPK